MKYHPLLLSWSRLLRVLSIALPLAIAAGLRGVTPSDEGVPVEIDVRSKIDPKWKGVHKMATIAHGKLYLLASVKEAPSGEKLVRPVDEAALVALLRKEMTAQGFREIAANETPEVVLTVTYGRGFLRNPYLEDAQVDEITGAGVASSTITLAKQAARQREFAFEAKMQKANAEKLYIAVTAWEYPATKGQKPNQFWRTVMVTDNPDERDLNLAMPAMLTAGVRYFDQDIKDPEVTINTKIPLGTVKLGPLNVIEEPKGGK